MLVFWGGDINWIHLNPLPRIPVTRILTSFTWRSQPKLSLVMFVTDWEGKHHLKLSLGLALTIPHTSVLPLHGEGHHWQQDLSSAILSMIMEVGVYLKNIQNGNSSCWVFVGFHFAFILPCNLYIHISCRTEVTSAWTRIVSELLGGIPSCMKLPYTNWPCLYRFI